MGRIGDSQTIESSTSLQNFSSGIGQQRALTNQIDYVIQTAHVTILQENIHGVETFT